MRIVLATHDFRAPWGSETYLLNVAEALERLGHQTTIRADRLGEMADFARSRGVRVEDSPPKDTECDAALAQDAASAYWVADRFPGVPVLFVAHSADAILQTPPQLLDVCPIAVAMSDRVASHLRSLAAAPEVVRLHQPVDLTRFRPLAVTFPGDHGVLAFGKNLPPGRGRLIARACASTGFELRIVGSESGKETTMHPEHELSAARIVIGTGRCVVEAMACGKAAYVYGVTGGDGWVTPESYEAIEADGFAGTATGLEIDGDRLVADLSTFSREMGQRNRDLAHAHHDSLIHARDLIALFNRAGAHAPAPTEAEELARLVRVQRQTEETASLFASETIFWRRQHDALRRSRRYRLGTALLSPVAGLRRLRQLRRDGRPSQPREQPTAEEWLQAHPAHVTNPPRDRSGD